jgi:hypothetical protein
MRTQIGIFRQNGPGPITHNVINIPNTGFSLKEIALEYKLLLQTVQTILTTEALGFDSRQTQEMFSYPRRSDRLWGPLSALRNNYQGLFSRDKAAWPCRCCQS